MIPNKITLGITGGTGCGKSMFSDIIRENGITVIDADKTGHEITQKGMAALDEIEKYFGKSVINDDGSLNRKKLGSIVFADREKLEILNKITHKYIIRLIDERVKADSGRITAVDGALLFECGIQCDYTVSVLADKDIRLERIINRDGISRIDAQNRISSQKSDEFYINNSDAVIYNNGTKEELEKNAVNIIHALEER